MQTQTAELRQTASSISMRTGKRYIDSLRGDGRQVYYEGERVQEVTRHSAFRGAIESIAGLYDVAADPTNSGVMTFPSPRTGGPVLRCYEVPRTLDDLRKRRHMHQRWAEATFGLMGRTPDHVASFFSGFVAKPKIFAAGGKQFADNVVRYHEHARDNHLFLAYAIVPPQIDRSKPAHRQSDPSLYAGVVRERDDGLVLRGAQQLATGAVLADELFLSCIHPLQPGDDAYAISVAMPMNTPGLKIYSRRSFARPKESNFDYPLSNRFDETDSLIVLNDVIVPWERVFVNQNIELCRDQWWKTPAHIYGNYQAQIRYMTKLRFLVGLAKRLNEITGLDVLPPVQIQMGELAALASLVECMVEEQEKGGMIDAEGAVWPSRQALYAIMALQSEMNPRIIDTIRELTGGAMIMLPSSVEDYKSPEIAEDLERYVASPGTTSRDRVALMKMAWDMIGTEFAGRHQQYEKFYGGASFLLKQTMYRNYDFAQAKQLVESALTLAEDHRR
jgi:4-hydroxyphenylacetate 3-monooxygenase